ncbi:DNA repair protein RecO [Acinetobacter pollinis]|uniref:DNA repair protein RecO n=1 Tax=Acinetobacter pollinis TaxID=2605270 RepID=UPI0018C31D8C|nr:DNA repair protein RecO C-terminal domain-containing protein [Acinetobacter pollinis]MBF7692932.1 DNA repair protein RecO C-terminal domain-containing protein [Acinetobacter pollinis]MBF7700489.1 DNA repair protein RecO C-terminal domain-containing protein [Acinetobacter pollinis]
MRNEVLHGYLIHYRKYRERSHIVHFFSHEYGRIDGILRQAIPPLFQPVQLLASGKSELKNFSQLEIDSQPIFFHGDAYFCGFYLNELLLKLCLVEEAMPKTYLQYHYSIEQLQFLSQQSNGKDFIRQLLRKFEYVFLGELGYDLDYTKNSFNHSIELDKKYVFSLSDGFILKNEDDHGFEGSQILSMQSYQFSENFNVSQLKFLSSLYRQLITSLLGDRPLKSRQLWIQHHQLQN